MLERGVLLVTLLAATACHGPLALLPGGALDGRTAPAPADWSFTDSVSIVQLETRPIEPYSVNIWAVGIGPAIYVHAGANRSTWVANMEADPKVRLRVDDSIYELVAARVVDQAEFDRFSAAYEKKYGHRPRNESVTEAYLFRLEPRSGATSTPPPGPPSHPS